MTTTLTHTPDLSTSSHVDFQPTGADWTAFHIYAHGTRATTDHLLVQASRLAREVVASGRASSWFVMRYWEGGPHIRLRLRNLDPTLREELADRLSRMALAAPEQQQLDAEAFYGPLAGPDGLRRHGWFPTGTVLQPAYEPEVERYAGPRFMDHAERMFCLSSRIAERATCQVIDGHDRLSIATGLLCQHARGLLRAGMAPDVVATGLRRYAQNFANMPGAPRVDVAAQIDRAERLYARLGTRVQELVWGPAAPDVDRAVNHTQPWTSAIADYAQDLMGPGIDPATAVRDLDEPQLRELTLRLWRAWRAVGSQWHMLANRLGVSIADEVCLSWMISLAVLRAPGPEAMHDPQTPQWRSFGEASKFRRGDMTVMGPRKDADRRTPPTRTSGRRIALPAPDERLVGQLSVALLERCTAYGSFDGPVSLDQLGTLLGLSAGARGRYEAVEAGQTVNILQTTYPRAGGVGSVQINVSIGQGCEVPSGHYEYDPVNHQLIHLGPDNRAALAQCCPYSQPDESGRSAVDVTHATVVVTVLLDSRVLAPRYGQRALRFGLLEAGHVSQNLLLVATSLGWKSITLGGFYDDELATAAGVDGIGIQPLYVIPVGVDKGGASHEPR